ncbi:MAG TPA: SET domain-containing protein-lysine N-methyltransferase [Opitutales bacterium]|jgi:SET domain-containing protein|nr:SET domain-containing protein-lysine N-methyltransferase [Opitutales bacterium]
MTQPAYFVNESRIHGRGMFAARQIPPGEPIVNYAGECITKKICVDRLKSGTNAFLFELDKNTFLDGNDEGNPARFANHSCEPNCEAVAEAAGIILRAIRLIVAGEELTFDYGFPLSAFPGHPCQCGATSCVGYIVAQSERWRVRSLLSRPGRSLLKNKMNQPQEACA